ncbi:hypothetical protein N7540_006519 [Penicillium herquei]|nr:hypothetical protein N7540_006519 [Penicillium herquei]
MADLSSSEVPTHYRSLSILFGYLSLIVVLLFTVCKTIHARYQARQKKNDWATGQRRVQFFLFSLLAALSIGTTWFYMIAFFFHSYDTWARSSGGLVYSSMDLSVITRMGLWLKNTYLFQEAWEAVSEDLGRFWWSGQIFGWTIGWGLFIGITGRRYRIPRVWVYMLLAQCVSVSFAANLFFATIAVSERPNEKDSSFTWSPSLVYELLPVVLSLVDAVAVPIFAYQKDFMFILLVPHFLTFVPGLLGPRDSFRATRVQGEKTTRRYAVFLTWIAATSVATQAYFSFLLLQDFGPDVSYGEVVQQLWDTIYAHPACSSVSWDVIMCTVSAFFWALVHGFKKSQMLGGQ